MATIVKHPQVEDYFVYLTLDEIAKRPNGIVDEYEANKIIVLKDYRLPVDLGIFSTMSGNLGKIEDPAMRKRLKKLTSVKFFKGAGKGFSEDEFGSGADLVSGDPVREAIYHVLCNGDAALFERASKAMKTAHEVAMGLFAKCFPSYEHFRIIPSVRLTTTLFENLHWDNHRIPEDFQQVRIFCNLDQRPRIWHTSHNVVTFIRQIYREHNLQRFAGEDPNKMLDYIGAEILGGMANACCDDLPKHSIAFDPGEIWFAESRMISHQIFYGERAMVYMFFVKPDGMKSPGRRFNAQVDRLHREMADGEQVPA